MNKEQGKAVMTFGYDSYVMSCKDALEILSKFSGAEKITNVYDLDRASIQDVPYNEVRITYLSSLAYKSIKLKEVLCEKENNSSTP